MSSYINYLMEYFFFSTCSCSFKNNVATACMSLGSSRRVRCNAQRGGGDNGKKGRCCEECSGMSNSPWLKVREFFLIFFYYFSQ